MSTPEAEARAFITGLFNEQILFNKLVGLRVMEVSADSAEIHCPLKPELGGNPIYKTLHGGVVATLLDTVGGIAAMAGIVDQIGRLGMDEVIRRLERTGTIDLRVDYLRPGRGTAFTATGRIIRQGNKVAVTRMELHNEAGEQIALGTATYIVG